ncbi:MAG: SUMF1/EgtB/PvdO family nonheme iron enzyme [Phycisphaerae bacterium]|nr:SUMF1/EgtB/PvdO family nonheme iron enzyme [Phycisphaerae bacterium]
MRTVIPALIGLVFSVPLSADVVIETAPIGDAGNLPDTRYETPGYGGVDYEYRIGKYEVTNSQYAAFLNAVATIGDPHGLYNTEMAGGWNDIGGISRIGSGTEVDPWIYQPRSGRGDRPVNYVNWYDTLRFANWLQNGQPSGLQDVTTTEDGAYDMSLGSSVVRKPEARVFLPNEDEWYKAAYYKGSGTNAGYCDYPSASDIAPTAELPPGTDPTNGSANYYVTGYLDTTYYTTVVGAYSHKPTASGYGTYDQGGNLWEWNESAVTGARRGVRGGSFNIYDDGMHASYRSDNDPLSTESYTYGFRIACRRAVAEVAIETASIGDEANPPDTRYENPGLGGVDYPYLIGKYEVTAGQYTEFLNAVAADDPYELYDTDMWDDPEGCQIRRSGEPGGYTYSVAPEWADRPVNHVCWGDAARFANWLHNGQPIGAQDLTTTENGSYYLDGAVTSETLGIVTRRPVHTWVIPSEDEWYKSAYYDAGLTAYHDYPTGTDATPNNGVPGGDTGDTANFIDDEWAIGSPYFRNEVGYYTASDSPYGTYDEGGNVWEWNETPHVYLRQLRGGCYGCSVDTLHASYTWWCSVLGDNHDKLIGFRVAYAPNPILGDANCDGVADVFDIDPFVLAITAQSEYVAQYPDCELDWCDCNADGYVDVFDIDAFVAILVGS